MTLKDVYETKIAHLASSPSEQTFYQWVSACCKYLQITAGLDLHWMLSQVSSKVVCDMAKCVRHPPADAYRVLICSRIIPTVCQLRELLPLSLPAFFLKDTDQIFDSIPLRYGISCMHGHDAPAKHPDRLVGANQSQFLPYLSSETEQNEQLYFNLQAAFGKIEHCLPQKYSTLVKGHTQAYNSHLSICVFVAVVVLSHLIKMARFTCSTKTKGNISAKKIPRAPSKSPSPPLSTQPPARKKAPTGTRGSEGMSKEDENLLKTLLDKMKAVEAADIEVASNTQEVNGEEHNRDDLVEDESSQPINCHSNTKEDNEAPLDQDSNHGRANSQSLDNNAKAMRTYIDTQNGFSNPLNCQSICWDLLVKATSENKYAASLADKMKILQDDQDLKAQVWKGCTQDKTSDVTQPWKNNIFKTLFQRFRECSPTYLASVFGDIEEFVWGSPSTLTLSESSHLIFDFNALKEAARAFKQ
ncbi:hypothetical protein SERLADRAFT_405815 [Serpula lacrymans var. lacrymans S7.9]|uniref:Uncharacterized protein n=1 Tax=Serpula lacrymans var. lacrymans (strain S7.9) TaxID=578457 RepID=F8NLA4_SERL9|nr:uncharacterized protein SERLADRAFT_405815 [Serpula lacrymans var. lacrymans S7.9]EGO28152.1 hypothetical protein SERLADRAFT_405815 [Serpula lacrymans var. lacrymans S7.9]